MVRSMQRGRVVAADGSAGAGAPALVSPPALVAPTAHQRLLRHSLFCLIGAVLLTACAGQPYKSGSAMRAPKNPAHGLQAPDTAAAPTQTPAPATIWQTADKLMGLAADELQAALGKPARIRDEVDGRIFQYIGSDCVLDLFLYPEAAAGAYRVSYAEARSIRAEKKPVDTCLKSLPAPIVADNAPTS